MFFISTGIAFDEKGTGSPAILGRSYL